MSQGPRVTRMVMFKHGVAYIERGGPAEGAFELSFKIEEMNDVLKSLAAWVVRGDARVGAVAFEAPEDPDTVLAERKLLLAPGQALAGLLASLRGRRIRADDGATLCEGEVIGLEATPGGAVPERQRLLLRTADGEVAIVDLASVRRLTLLEGPSQSDLGFLIDKSRASTAGRSRVVRLALAGRAEDLRVAYVIPAPVWRVSYRLAREGEEILVMAWAIVHNPADEDLEEIALTLTTGQPVSFVIDLYNPKRIERAVVEEETRAAAAPTRYERARTLGYAPPPAAAPASMSRSADSAFAEVLDEALEEGEAKIVRSMSSMAEAAEGAAVGADRGELFEYRVAAPVSLKRGGSAMVPLIAARVRARRERIWRKGMPPAPDLVLSFTNDTGAVLEEGPAVVYDEATYAGEAMVPYSARGAGVKLAFAKDLAVRCRLDSTTRSRVAGVRLTAGFLLEDQWHEEHSTLAAESDHGEEVEVIFELPRRHGRELDPSGAQPFEETASYRRFLVKVPPGGRAEVVARERWPIQRRAEYRTLSGHALDLWLEGRFLDQATFDALKGVLAKWEEARQLDARRERREREQKEAHAKQGKISEQLAVLKESGPEGALRLRYVKELEAEQDKVNACEEDIRRLRDAAEAARADAQAALAQLTAARGS